MKLLHELAFPAIMGLVLYICFLVFVPAGLYQVVEITHPKDRKVYTYLLNTRTGRIQQLVYGMTDNLYWANSEALNEREYDKRYNSQ